MLPRFTWVSANCAASCLQQPHSDIRFPWFTSIKSEAMIIWCLTAAVAVDAVGKDNVTGVGMPGPYSSEGSVTDARLMAERLGIRFELASITGAYEKFLEVLQPLFRGAQADVTEENLQSRLRGV